MCTLFLDKIRSRAEILVNVEGGGEFEISGQNLYRSKKSHQILVRERKIVRYCWNHKTAQKL